MTFDESVLYKDREQKVLEITKQVGVEVELEKSNMENLHLEQMDVKTAIFTWRFGQRDLYLVTGRICGSRQGTHGVQAH